MADAEIRALERQEEAAHEAMRSAYDAAAARHREWQQVDQLLRHVRHRADGCRFDITGHCVNCSRSKS